MASVVATSNYFAILNDDDGRSDAPVPVAVNAESVVASSTSGAQRGRPGPASRGGRYYARGGRSKTSEVRETPDNEDTTENKKPTSQLRSRGRGGRSGDRGSRPARGRPFDRQSQTGKVDSDKKVSQGWGNNDGEKELIAEESGSFDAVTEAVNPDSNWTKDDTVETDWATNVPLPTEETEIKDVANAVDGPNLRSSRDEPDDNTLTLEQYLAQKKEKQSELPKLEGIRQTSDTAEWKDVVPLSKSKTDEDSYFIGKTKSAPKQRTKKDEKVYLEIDARFERPPRGGGQRGGDRGSRGYRNGRGGRGMRGRGGHTGSNSNQPDVDVLDQFEFPSLPS